MPCGIALMDSSLAEMIIGNTMKAKVNQPAIKETFQPKANTNIPIPKIPNTMDGTPARFRIDSLTAFKILPGREYSLKKIALRTPKVIAIIIAPATRSNVPAIQGQMPPLNRRMSLSRLVRRFLHENP